jgi:hypothetical protein
MSELMASGHLVDGILVLMVIEGCGWWWFRRSLDPGALAGFLVNLAAGMSLLLALRGALTHSGWPILACWLGAAFLFHVLDMALRLKRRRPEVILRAFN